MRPFIYTLGIVGIILFSAGDALAAKPWIFGWWPGHFERLNFEKPYLYEGKLPHNSQWDHDIWQPQDWIVQRQDGVSLIQSWYVSGIIAKQYVRNDVPVLAVGPAFYHLGGHDKQRVMQTIDNVYQITSRKENGIFQLRDSRSGDYIGLYSSHGLMLQ